MIIVDTALEGREREGRPIRVALIGAGFMSRGLANHILHTTPGMRLAGVFNRGTQRAVDLCEYAGLKDVVSPATQGEVDLAIREGKTVATGDAFLLARTALQLEPPIPGSISKPPFSRLNQHPDRSKHPTLPAPRDATGSALNLATGAPLHRSLHAPE